MAELHDDFETRYGLVRIGGDLAPATLLEAYCSGVFPWFDEGWPICWWSPDPRAIFELHAPQSAMMSPVLPSPPWGEGPGVRGGPSLSGQTFASPLVGEGLRYEVHGGLHISHRLARTIRSGKFQVTVNRAFGDVIRGCAHRAEGSWITDSMIEAYERLHRLGVAHSVEVWRENKLAGGLYGVAIAGFFAGESMFHAVTDASKVALAFAFQHLQKRGFLLFDTQFVTDHTLRMGAMEIPRRDYLVRLQQALQVRTSFAEEDGDEAFPRR